MKHRHVINRHVGTDRRVRVDKRLERHINPDDMLVTCWCEATFVHMPAADIAAGRTASCGRPDCHPPSATRQDKHRDH